MINNLCPRLCVTWDSKDFMLVARHDFVSGAFYFHFALSDHQGSFFSLVIVWSDYVDIGASRSW